MMALLPATTRNTFIASSGMRNVVSFRTAQALFAGLDRDEDLACNRWQEVGIWEGIHSLFIDVDEVPGAAGLCVERHCEMG
jgi:hypothetical protein